MIKVSIDTQHIDGKVHRTRRVKLLGILVYMTHEVYL